MEAREILRCNEPKTNEWLPKQSIEGPLIPGLEHNIEGYLSEVQATSQKVKTYDRALEEAIRERKAIEDPLAYYVPYHSPGPGIYFRINKILPDFRSLINKYSHIILRGITPGYNTLEELWIIYVMHIFWHELAHHAIEDVATILEGFSKGGYPLMNRSAEEGLCEHYAFSTRRLSLPFLMNIPLLTPILGPKFGHLRPYTLNRRTIWDCLYYHWKRGADPVYRPRIEPSAATAVNGLWNAVWNGHKNGVNVLSLPGEIYDKIFVVTI